MKKFFLGLLIVLLASTKCFASCETSIDGYVVCDFDISDWNGLSSAPAISQIGSARMYFDISSGKLKCSQNGGAYTDCVGGGGGGSGTVSTGTAGYFAYYPSTGTTVDDQTPLFTNGTNVGIGTTQPNNLLQVAGLINFDGVNDNTKIGIDAGKNIVSGASFNTFLGYEAGKSGAVGGTTAATGNNAIGYQALLKNTTGDSNVAEGYQSLFENTTGSNNVAVGLGALGSNTKGVGNTAIGWFSFLDLNNTSAVGANTAIGYDTGRDILTGVNNTIIGANVTGLPAALSNNIIIADGAGNRRINVDANGNVGLGTTAAVGRLSVVGDEARIWTGAGSDNQALSSGELYVQGDLEVDGTIYGDGSGLINIPSASGGWTDGGTNVYTSTSTDNVGVGTTQPGSLVDISSTATGYLFRVEDGGPADGSPLIIDEGGNVGIGTYVAGAKLTVRSGSSLGSFVGTSATTDSITMSNNNLTTATLLNVTSSSTSGITNELANFMTSGSNSQNTGTVLHVQQTGTSSLLTALQVTDLGSVNGGYVVRFNDATGDTDITPFIIDHNGNVGIGTTGVPAGKLDIRGDEVRIWSGSGSDNQALSSGELYVQGDLEVDGTFYSQAITDNTSFWFCTDALCTGKCQANIVGGLVMSCP